MTFFYLVSQSLDTVHLKQKRIWSLYVICMYHILKWLVAHCKTQWGFFENKNVLHFLSFRKLFFINFPYLNFTNSFNQFCCEWGCTVPIMFVQLGSQHGAHIPVPGIWGPAELLIQLLNLYTKVPTQLGGNINQTNLQYIRVGRYIFTLG